MKLHNPLQKDDPRLLQYVLKEISTQDLQIVEQAIAQQPEIAAEIKVLTSLYSDISELQSNPKELVLSQERRKKLFADTIYKKSESASWFSKIASFGSFKYATGGLVAATFAFLVFNQSLKHEVKSSKDVTDAALVSEDLEQARLLPVTIQNVSIDRSRGGGEVAMRESDVEKQTEQTLSDAIEKSDQKLAKKELPMKAAAAEGSIVTTGSGNNVEMEQHVEMDVAAADSADEKKLESNPLRRRAVEAQIAPRIGVKSAASGSKFKDTSGSYQTFSASNAKPKSGVSSNSEESNSLSAFGGSGASLKGVAANEESKIEVQEMNYIVRINSEKLSLDVRVQLRKKILQCLSQSILGRKMNLIYDTKSLKLTHSFQNLHAVEQKIANCISGKLAEEKLNSVKDLESVLIEIEPDQAK